MTLSKDTHNVPTFFRKSFWLLKPANVAFGSRPAFHLSESLAFHNTVSIFDCLVHITILSLGDFKPPER